MVGEGLSAATTGGGANGVCVDEVEPPPLQPASTKTIRDETTKDNVQRRKEPLRKVQTVPGKTASEQNRPDGGRARMLVLPEAQFILKEALSRAKIFFVNRDCYRRSISRWNDSQLRSSSTYAVTIAKA